MAGRAMIALFSVATGLLVFFWSRKFFGDAGALLSLGFFVFSPDFLAHGALVTSDVCMVFFFLAATGAWWRHLHDGRARSWWLSAVLLGLAFVAKYSALILLPMLGVMALVRAGAPEPLVFAGRSFTTRRGKIAASILSGLGHGAVVVAVIWAFYGFRFSAFNPQLPAADHFIRPWRAMMEPIGVSGKIIDLMGHLHALPEAFLYGLAYVLYTVKARAAFLNGEYSLTGWPSYFLWTFFLKTTVPLMLSSLAAAALAVNRWRRQGRATLQRDLYRFTPLLALFVIYWLSSVTSHLNIGHRHILPTYPVLFIGVGALGAWIRRTRQMLAVVAVGLFAWHATAAVRIAPHYLAYFNEIAGGPENGRHHLVDSSLDWGQDLPGLKAWLDANNPGSQPVFLSYFGSGEPEYYHLRTRRIGFMNNFKFPTVYYPLEGGLYCISATNLSLVYSPFHGSWNFALEKEYQRLRELEPTFLKYTRDAAARVQLERELSPQRWQDLVVEHDRLRFARLCHYLRVRKPEAQIGYSILVFRLSDQEIARATAGSIADWSALIEQTATR
jgi:hypothetical protein